jgi:hypothetical protein
MAKQSGTSCITTGTAFCQEPEWNQVEPQNLHKRAKLAYTLTFSFRDSEQGAHRACCAGLPTERQEIVLFYAIKFLTMYFSSVET